MSFGHSLCQTSNLREYGPQIMFHKSHFLKLVFKLCAIFLLSTRTGQDINYHVRLYVFRFWIQFDIMLSSPGLGGYVSASHSVFVMGVALTVHINAHALCLPRLPVSLTFQFSLYRQRYLLSSSAKPTCTK